MKHLFRHILLLNLIFFSNSNIHSCVSVHYDPDWYPYEKIFIYNLENQVRESANKFIQPTGFSKHTIPNKLLPEYELKINTIISAIQKLINNNLENFVYLENVEQAVKTHLAEFKKKLSKIILSYNIENKTNSIIQKIAYKKGVNLNSLPYALVPEYNEIKYAIILKLQQNMLSDGRDYVKTDEIKKVVHKDLDPFWDKVKNYNNSPWTNSTTSFLNAIFNQTPNAQSNNANNTAPTTTPKTNFLNQTCVICKNQFIYGDRVGILNCTDKHFFHEGCIKQWFTCQKRCPICEKEVGANGKDLIIAQIETVTDVTNANPYLKESCRICLDNFKSGDKVGILNCNGKHFFHKDCIYAWLNTDARKSCPLCRQENLIVSQIHDVK